MHSRVFPLRRLRACWLATMESRHGENKTMMKECSRNDKLVECNLFFAFGGDIMRRDCTATPNVEPVSGLIDGCEAEDGSVGWSQDC